MIRYRAAWILPVSAPPIRDGWVEVDNGRIAAIGGPGPDTPEVDLGKVAVIPGLVNAHTHLELSYLRGAVPAAPAFVSWIRQVIAARRQFADVRAPEITEGIDRALVEATASGTTLVGDISNTLVTYAPLTGSGLGGVVFYEVIRFSAPNPDAVVDEAWGEIARLRPTPHLRASLAAHAPYSVAPRVFQAIRRLLDRVPSARCSVHLSESAEEVEFLAKGTGAWRALLEDLGSWDAAWEPPGVSPVQALDDSGFLNDRVLAVHGVQMTASDLARLRARGTTLVTCPRSNRHTGAGDPPIRDFYASGVRVAVGTDSLASAPDLNVFAELATMHELAPDVPASALIDSATREGARALGFDRDYGTIETGKLARLLIVSVPGRVDDVEEYLVSGIEPDQIRWLEDPGLDI